MKNYKKIFFSGIGGISMSGLAEILNSQGISVCGSDNVATEITDRLSALGITVFIPNSEKNITDDVELVVYTAAIKKDNPEFAFAKEKGLTLMERAEFIGELIKSYKTNICVAGTHGKTTTTSMICDCLNHAGFDPTVSIGGHMISNGLNYRIGGKDIFVLEACEYNNSFLHFAPDIGIILNIDDDHPDFYKSFDDLVSSFNRFARNIKPEGFLVIDESTPCFEAVTKNVQAKIITIGCETSDFRAGNIKSKQNYTFFDIIHSPVGARLTQRAPNATFRASLASTNKVMLPFAGEYNVANALACFAALRVLGINPDTVSQGLSTAKGIKRRFEYKGIHKGITVIDDYAHHPTEIKACLAALKQFVPGLGKIICLFQPHTYSRTKHLLQEFSAAFFDADMVFVLPIFPAREVFDDSISSEMLVEGIKKNGTCANFCQNFYESGNFILERIKPGDVLITLGAGEAYKVGDALIRSEFSTLSTCF